MTTTPDNELKLDTLGPLLQELALTAAVRERFRPVELLKDWIARHHPDVSDDAVNSALDVSLSLAAVSGASSEISDTYQLPLHLRREVLAMAGLDAVRKAVERERPRTQTERSFAALVAGRLPDPNTMGRADLLALASGAAWAQGLEGAGQVAPDEVARHIRDQEFVERVGGADLNLFVGRAALLRALERLWTLPDRPTVLIEGPGGIGKSIAVARFFQILLKGEAECPRPDAILHLDFDLPDLQSAAFVSIEIEIVRQLALRWSPAGNERLLSLLRSFGSTGIRKRSDSGRGFSTEGLRDHRQSLTQGWLLQQAVELFAASRNAPLRLILFADSFERAESLDEIATRTVSHIADALRRAGADVMVLYAARAYRDPEALDPGGRPAIQRVQRFLQAEAVTYLSGKAKSRGISLSRQDADRANRTINGWPLGLRIAVSMLGSEPQRFDVEDWLTAIGSGGRSVQATLYERLLDRIKNEDLRKLAKPGLFVRRITPGVIEAILAEPCGLGSGYDSNRLMSIAEHEGQLFQQDPADPGALWHRQDLREIMLPVLRKDVPLHIVNMIHDNAVAFYADQEGAIARAEELYHRLVRGDDRGEITARWTEQAGRRLLGALEELPPGSAAIVRLLLGGGRSDAARRTSEADLQLDELRAVARNRLLEGDIALEDIFAAAGVQESILSPLGDVHAQLLLRQGRHDDVLNGAKALSGNGHVPSLVKARVYMIAAGLAEGLGDAARAMELWRNAQRLGRYLLPVELLTVRVARARVSRLTGLAARGRTSHVRAACELLVATEYEVRSSRVVAIEAVAELSEVLQWPSGRSMMVGPRTNSLLVSLFRELSPLFPSAVGNRMRLDQLSVILGQNPEFIHTPYELDKFMHRFFTSPDPQAHARAIEALRSEVDAAFAAAAGRDAFGSPLSEAMVSLSYS